MKLHANIDDMALIVKDLLPRDLFLQVADFDFTSVKDKKRQDSLIDWPRELYVDDTPQNNRTMESVKTVINLAVCLKGEYEFVDPIFKEVLDIIKSCEYIPFKDNSSLVLNYYEYAKHAGINWHTDQDYTLNYSFYIHKKWDKDWGGETLIDTERGLPLASIPFPNSMCVIKNGIWHRVSPVLGPEKRKVLQIRGRFYE